MANHWKIEVKDESSKKVSFECNNDGVVKITEQQRDVKIEELNRIWDMTKMMNSSKYKKMECTKL